MNNTVSFDRFKQAVLKKIPLQHLDNFDVTWDEQKVQLTFNSQT